jgi:electron transfer flavoprotein alpha subunit
MLGGPDKLTAILFLSSAASKEVAARLAVRLGIPLVTDAVALTVAGSGALTTEQSAFAGSWAVRSERYQPGSSAASCPDVMCPVT